MSELSERVAADGVTSGPVGHARRQRERGVDLVLDGLAVLGFALFAILTVVLWAHVTPFFDPPLRDAALRWSAWNGIWDLLSNAANYPLIVIGVAIVLWLFWKHRRREAILVIVTLVLVTAGSEGVKQLVHRPRPPGSATVVPGVVYSYPSGHELEAVTILGIVALLVWRSGAPRWGRVAFAIAVALFCAAVALARVAIDAHWPSDVLGGAIGGIGVLALVIRLTRHDDASARPSPAKAAAPTDA